MIENLEGEEWRDIEGYEGFYQVSNKGRIKSLEKTVNCTPNSTATRKMDERLMKLVDNGRGYFYVKFCVNDKRKNFYVHRLVAKAFIDNPNQYNEVNHKDEVKTNNDVSNLEWCNRKYNINYGTHIERTVRTNRINGFYATQGERARKCCSKRVLQIDKTTNEIIQVWPSISEAGRIGGFNIGNISACCLKKPHCISHKGFIWRFADEK